MGSEIVSAPQAMPSTYGYKSIVKGWSVDTCRSCDLIATGLGKAILGAATGAGLAGVGVLVGGVAGAYGLAESFVGLGGVCVYAPAAFAARSTAHTYSKIPLSVRDRLSVVPSGVSALASRVADSSCVKSTLSYCEAKTDSMKKWVWETAAARVLPLAVQGSSDKVARKEKHESYPERQAVLDHQVSWKFPFASYAPPYFDAPIVMENEQKFKDELVQILTSIFGELGGEVAEINFEKLVRESCLGKIDYENDMPLNPRGRTGLAGRGVLPDWGPNYEGHPMITRLNPDKGNMEVLVIKKDDKWALPAGLGSNGESIAETLSRVVEENAGVTVSCLVNPITVEQNYVPDARNTDNAWIEKRVVHRHLGLEEGRQYNQLSEKAAWISIDDIEKMDEDSLSAILEIKIPRWM